MASSTMTGVGAGRGRSWRQTVQAVGCALFGHRVDNRAFSRIRGAVKSCPCGAAFLQEDGSETRISHTASCFVFGHSYIESGERCGHREYVCRRCGHPLLFEAGRDPYAGHRSFRKQVRYLCNLFGHRVHRVTGRGGLTEYACDCGHAFLKREPDLEVVKHPPACLFAGHFVRFVERRGAYVEYRCRACGHTFCFRAGR